MVNNQLLFPAILCEENKYVKSLCVSVQKQQQQKTFSLLKNEFGYHCAPENHFRNYHPSMILQRSSFSDVGNNVLLS